MVVFGLFWISGKNTATTDNVSGSGKLKVATSFLPITDLVSQVGGEKIEVVQILPSGSSPHTYEPIAKDQQQLTGSKLAFVIGYELDSWADVMLNSAAPQAQIITLDKDIALLNSGENSSTLKDPHYWLSYDNAMAMVKTINSALAAKDPVNKAYFQQNANSYLAKLEAAKNNALERTGKLVNKKFITFHSAFNYLAKELGLEVVATIEEFPGQEPDPQYLANVGTLIRKYNIKTLFKEPELSDSIVSALAKDYGATVATLDPEGGLENTTNYLDMMSYNIDTIVKALQ
jgi:zinc transport system substrate-binding protein